jgi:hypothetical protein
MDKRYSLEELNLIFADEPGQIRLQMTMASGHSQRAAAVERAIDFIAQDLSRTRHLRQHKSEDLLTTDVVTGLVLMGFQASHDTDIGGHCDVVVGGRDNFLWLGEAKTHKDYDWLYKGFQQLCTRYSTGLPGQDIGGMLIYCYNQNALEVMRKWRERLSSERTDLQVDDCEGNPLNFRSTHPHDVSGLPYRVRHVPILLYFKPEDKAAPAE